MNIVEKFNKRADTLRNNVNGMFIVEPSWLAMYEALQTAAYYQADMVIDDEQQIQEALKIADDFLGISNVHLNRR